MFLNTKRIVAGGCFIALAIGLGYAFAQFPNIELVTAVIFVAGYTLGLRYGAIIGLSAEFIYSTFNPYGMAALPVLAAQLLAMMLVGIAGALFGLSRVDLAKKKVFFVFGMTGLLLTLNFDFLTTLATAAVLGFTKTSLLALLTVGSVFYATHLFSNTLIFALVVPALLRGFSASPYLRGLLPTKKSIESLT